LADLADHCAKKLAWPNFEPLIEYLDLRHPFAGNLYEYSDFSGAKDEDILSPLPVAALLRHIPFATLFSNITLPLMANPKIVKLLQQSIQHIPEGHIPLEFNYIVLFLSTTLTHHWQRESREVVLATMDACFSLLESLMKIAQGNEAIYGTLTKVISDHSVLREMFLVCTQTEKDDNSLEDDSINFLLQSFDKHVAHLVLQASMVDAPHNGTPRIVASLCYPYRQKVVGAILDKLNQIENKLIGISALDGTIVSLFFRFANLYNEEDLSSVLDQLLRLDLDWLFSTFHIFSAEVQRFNSMLLEVLSRLSKVTSSRSTISAGSFKTLAYLWQSYPSPELDTVIYEFLEVSLPPNILGYATHLRNNISSLI